MHDDLEASGKVGHRKPVMHIVIWSGPVSAAHLKSARMPAGALVTTIGEGVGGIGSSHFAALAAKYGDSLRALLAARGIDLDAACTVTLAGFSAAHGLIERLLRGPESARVSALLAADAYYTSTALAPKVGYRAFIERAAAGGALALMTTSTTAGATYPSASEATGALVAGMSLAPVEVRPPLPEPDRAEGRRGFLWADYGQRFTHREHAVKLAPLYFSHVVTPYLARLAAGESAPEGGGAFEAIAALGLLWGLTR